MIKTVAEEPALDAFELAEQKLEDQLKKEIEEPEEEDEEDVIFDEDEDASLLPPAQPETAYPQMPLVSSLPGTTASPIRVPCASVHSPFWRVVGKSSSQKD